MKIVVFNNGILGFVALEMKVQGYPPYATDLDNPDFALMAEREEGKNSRDSIYEACMLRLRPILMTTMAAMLGALPLALGTGTGSELRKPLGITIIGGLVVSQMLTLYTTPVVYLYFDRFQHWVRRRKSAGSKQNEPRKPGLAVET